MAEKTADESRSSALRTRCHCGNVRGTRLPPEVLTPDEVHRLIAACSVRTPTGIRHRALIGLLWRTGLRISEALTLFPKDLDLERGAIRVFRGKGGRSRVVGVDDTAVRLLRPWLEVRATRGLRGNTPVFCSMSGNPLEKTYLRVLFQRLGRKAGIEKRVHAHGLRHTHAAELRSEGIDLGIISKQLGHRSLATTAVYLDHIAPAGVIQAIRDRA